MLYLIIKFFLINNDITVNIEFRRKCQIEDYTQGSHSEKAGEAGRTRGIDPESQHLYKSTYNISYTYNFALFCRQ